MANMKSLNLIGSEPLNTHRALKNPVLTESDGQAFAQTLRQQMQPETNAKLQTEADNRLETQSAVLQQQTGRARLALQSNQAKPAQLNQSEQIAKARQNVASVKNKSTEVNIDAKETVSNRNQNEQIDLALALSMSDETMTVLTTGDVYPNVASPATESMLDSGAEKDAKQVEVDENALANMGWLASMMAMRDNQTMPKANASNRTVTIDAEHTLSNARGVTDKIWMPDMAQANGLVKQNGLDKPIDSQVGEDNQSVDDLSMLQEVTPVNQPALDITKGLPLGQLMGREDGSVALTTENVVTNAGLIPQPNIANNQAADSSNVLEPLTEKLAAEAADNAQATTASNLLAQVPPTMGSALMATQSMASQILVSQLDVPFGLKGWQEAMNNQVMRMTQQGNELATLTLSPPDLGPVQVVLRVDNQSVDAAFVSDNANVRQALEDGLQDLKERMASQGLQLGNTFVGNGNQAQQHFGTPEQPTRTSFNPTSVRNTEAMSAPVDRSPVRTVPLGLVDTFV